MTAAVFSVDTPHRQVALTIDDSPDPRTTPALLDALNSEGVSATFFVISGRVPGNEAILTRVVDSGHELGNHMAVDRASVRLQPAAFEAEMRAAHRVLSRFDTVRWLRPAAGWYSGAMAGIAASHGYRIVLGSVFPLDHLIPSSRFAARFILAGARPGSIIVLHDGNRRGPRTVATLRYVLPRLRARGLEVVTVGGLLAASR